MNELFKIIFTPVLQGLTKYYRQTITAIMIVLIAWFIVTSRQDSKDHNDTCQEDLKQARKEISDLNKQLIEYALYNRARANKTAKNDSIVRKQSEEDIKQVMP